MESMLHPNNDVTTEQLLQRISALESSDNRYALRGGSAVTYDTDGRIATLVAGTITGQVVNAQIASIAFAKITDVSITNAQIVSLSADKLTAGTIDASVIAVTHIDADNISTGSLSANRIASNSITGAKIAANTIEAGNIKAGAIDGMTITGALVRTSASGARVELSSDDMVQVFDSNGYNVGHIYGSASKFYVEADDSVGIGQLILVGYDDPVGVIIQGGLGVTTIVMTGSMYSGGSYVNINDNLNITGWAALGGDMDLNSHDINEIRYLKFISTSNSTEAGRVWYYASGDSRYFRARMGSWNGQFDQTGF